MNLAQMVETEVRKLTAQPDKPEQPKKDDSNNAPFLARLFRDALPSLVASRKARNVRLAAEEKQRAQEERDSQRFLQLATPPLRADATNGEVVTYEESDPTFV